MKNKIRNIAYVLFGLGALALIPVFLSHDNPIEVVLPELTVEEVNAQQEAQQKEAHASAQRALMRRVYRCETDDDCIIVDKDPCGCLIGPSAKAAINVGEEKEFNRLYKSNITKACPDTEISTEKECSETAQAVCEEHSCKIVYEP